MKHLIKLLGVLMFVLLAIGSGTSNQSSKAPATPECQQARSIYQMCYGGCLASTPGGFIYAAGRCGNVCSGEARYATAACR